MNSQISNPPIPTALRSTSKTHRCFECGNKPAAAVHAYGDTAETSNDNRLIHLCKPCRARFTPQAGYLLRYDLSKVDDNRRQQDEERARANAARAQVETERRHKDLRARPLDVKLADTLAGLEHRILSIPARNGQFLTLTEFWQTVGVEKMQTILQICKDAGADMDYI